MSERDRREVVRMVGLAAAWSMIRPTLVVRGHRLAIAIPAMCRSDAPAGGVAMQSPWATMPLPEKHNVVAADGSEIRVLLEMPGASTVHCTLRADAGTPPGVSFATYNVGIDEIWYFLEGEGQIWRKRRGTQEEGETKEVRPGVSLTIPPDVIFQFRNTGRGALKFLCITMPPWKPGTNVKVDDCKWPVGPGA
jgi:mannose-6-phosphate isomerase-like protein (cupin superfamily)